MNVGTSNKNLINFIDSLAVNSKNIFKRYIAKILKSVPAPSICSVFENAQFFRLCPYLEQDPFQIEQL